MGERLRRMARQTTFGGCGQHRGAGDSMVGGLIYGLLMRESSEHTLRLATAVAALAVSQSNVGITDRPQLAAMMARVDLQPFN